MSILDSNVRNAVGGALKAVFGGSMETTGVQVFTSQAGAYIQVYVQHPHRHRLHAPGLIRLSSDYSHVSRT